MESMLNFVREIGMTAEELCVLMDSQKEDVVCGSYASEIDIMRINEGIEAEMERYPFEV